MESPINASSNNSQASQNYNQQNGNAFDLDANAKTNLIVNYLPQTMSQDDMKALFQSVGEVDSCKLIKDKLTGQSLGYGFVNYTKEANAEKAINTLNGLKLNNKTIKVSFARPSSEFIKGANLYVAGLPKHWTQTELENLFSEFGKIITSRILCDNMSGLSKGVGFVRFDQRTEAEKSIAKLNGCVPDGAVSPLTVKFANNPAQGGGGGSGSSVASFPPMAGGAFGIGSNNHNAALQAAYHHHQQQQHNFHHNNPAAHSPYYFPGAATGPTKSPFGFFNYVAGSMSATGGGPTPTGCPPPIPPPPPPMHHPLLAAAAAAGGGAVGNRAALLAAAAASGRIQQSPGLIPGTRFRYTPMTSTAHLQSLSNGSLSGHPNPNTDNFNNNNFLLNNGIMNASSSSTSLTHNNNNSSVAITNPPNYPPNMSGSVAMAALLNGSSSHVPHAHHHASPHFFAPPPPPVPPFPLHPASAPPLGPPMTSPTMFPIGSSGGPAGCLVAPGGQNWCVFAYNLPPETEDSTLWQLFGPFGAVTSVKVIRDAQTQKCKGFGFVNMSNFDDALAAIQTLNGYALGNRILQVSFKTMKKVSTTN